MLKKYLLIDSEEKLEYFLFYQKDEYFPIIIDHYLSLKLAQKGISCLEVSDFLDKQEIKDISFEAGSFLDQYLERIDSINKDSYALLFNNADIKLFSQIIGLYLKRFAINVCLFLNAIRKISQMYHVDTFYYIHDGKKRFLCTNKDYKAFFYPEDFIYKLISYWGPANNIKIKKINFVNQMRQKVFLKDASSVFLLNKFSQLKRFIKNIVRCVVLIKGQKNNLLILSPSYAFSSLFNSKLLAGNNIISWNVDHDLLPDLNFLQRVQLELKLRKMFNSKYKYVYELVDKINLKPLELKRSQFLVGFDLIGFIAPLMKGFLKEKLPEITKYWYSVSFFHEIFGINLLLWGNSPLRYPGGIATEFCRLKGIPIVGTQHGGFYGSNKIIHFHSDSDYSKSDYWFSYGFTLDDIEDYHGGKKQFAKIIPVGSSDIAKLQKAIQRKERQKICALFPLARRNNFFTQTNPMIQEKQLAGFQKAIIDVLVEHAGDKAILTYPPNQKACSAEIYLSDLDLVNSNVEIDWTQSFKDLLQIYDPEIIILEVTSTALLESLASKSKIIVYNDVSFTPLTSSAHKLLSKRACVCDSQADFLDQLRGFLVDDYWPDNIDVNNKEFFEKYCLFNGDPQVNIENSIMNILAGKGDFRK